MDEYGELISDFFGAAKDFTEVLFSHASEIIKPLSPLQKNLKEALGPDQHGCSTAVLGELTRTLGYGGEPMMDVLEELTKTLELPPYHKKELYRAITLIEFVIGHGNPSVVEEIRRLEYLIRRVNTYGLGSQGEDLRTKCENVLSCLSDEEHLERHRINCADKCGKFVGISSAGHLASNNIWGPPPPSASHWPNAPSTHPQFNPMTGTYEYSQPAGASVPKKCDKFVLPTQNSSRNDTRHSTSSNFSAPVTNHPFMDPEWSVEEDSNIPEQLRSSMFAPPPQLDTGVLKSLNCRSSLVGRYSIEESSDDPFGVEEDRGHRTHARGAESIEVFGNGAGQVLVEDRHPVRHSTGGWFNDSQSVQDAFAGSDPFHEAIKSNDAKEVSELEEEAVVVTMDPIPTTGPAGDLISEEEVEQEDQWQHEGDTTPVKDTEAKIELKSKTPVVNLLD